MEQSDLVELAQQGNIEAIATLITRALASDSLSTEPLRATTNLQNGCLEILLESSQVPEPTIVEKIRRSLQPLTLDFIQSVKISAQQTGESDPSWMKKFTFQQFLAMHPRESSEGSPISPVQVPSTSSDSVSDSILQHFESSEFLRSLRTFHFSAVVPYREALSSDLYGHSAVKLLLFFGLFPLAVGFLANQTGLAKDLEQTAWILGVYYATIWGVVLHNLIRPADFSWQDTLKCLLFTVFVGIPLLLFFQEVPPFNLLYAATEWDLIPQLIGFVLGVGVLEEVTKALPVYLFLLRPGRLSDPLTSAFYGSMSGLGFAISEGAVYSIQYAFGLLQRQLDFGSYLLTNTIRFVSLPLFHAIWAGIVGYFIGLAAINPSRRGAILFIGVAVAAVLHGLYNTFASGLLGLMVIAFSILLFVAYLRRSQHMVDMMRQAELKAKTSEASMSKENW